LKAASWEDSFDKSIDQRFNTNDEQSENDDDDNDEVTSHYISERENIDIPIWNNISGAREKAISHALVKYGDWKSKKERYKCYPFLTERIARQIESRDQEDIQDGILMLKTLVADEKESQKRQKEERKLAKYGRKTERNSWDLGSLFANKRLIATIGLVTGQLPTTTYKHLKKHKVTAETCWSILNAPTLRDQQKIIQTFSPSAFSEKEDNRKKLLIKDNEESPPPYRLTNDQFSDESVQYCGRERK
jgi:hypothetical protein